MGLFSSDTEIYTSAAVYNLAGDEAEHVDGLKSAILGSVLQGNNDIGGTIAMSVQGGHGNRMRRYFRYMKEHAPERRLQAQLSYDRDVDPAAVVEEIKTLLGLGPNDAIDLRKVEVNIGVLHYFAEAWVAENYPDLTQDDWGVDLDAVGGEMVITLIEDGVTMEYRMELPEDFLWATEEGGLLLYANYAVTSTDPVTQDMIEGRSQLFVYRVGSGNAVLDAAVEDLGELDAEFYPVLTFRYKEKSIRDLESWADRYEVAKKAYRRLTGQRLDDLLDQIEENEDIGDIDFCHLVSGVAMNTTNQAGLEYLYLFWKRAMAMQTGTKEDALYDPTAEDRANDQQASIIIGSWLQGYGPGLTLPMPEIIGRPQRRLARTVLHFIAEDLDDLSIWGGLSGVPKQFYYTISWRYVEETIHVGNAKHFDGDTSREPLKVGEFWMQRGPGIRVWDRRSRRVEVDDDRDRTEWYWDVTTAPTVHLYHQHARNQYRRLEICESYHRNYIYKTHSENTQGHSKLGSDEPSAFIVPFSDDISREMGLRKINNLQSSCSYLVFNAYEKVEVKWYQKGIFKILFTIAIIAISIYIAGPAGLAGGSGILGANVAVGLSLGMSTVLSAAIAGAIVNSIAAMIVTQIVMWGSSKLFGEKWGKIIGIVASFFALNMATNYFGNGSLAVDWGRMMRVENLMNLSNAVTDATVAFLDADTQEILAQMEEEAEDYEETSEEIQDRYEELLGVTEGLIDPMMLTSAAMGYVEPMDTFLSRTLLTGSDIAGITNSMISDFVDVTLRLPDATD